MGQLEGSTLDLIRRRFPGSTGMGYMVILTVVGMIVALPLVKVDLVATVAGVITTGEETVDLRSPIGGQVDSSLIRDLAEVHPGDTLLWFCRLVPETRIRECRMRISRQLHMARDVRAILEGRLPVETARYIQSHRAHLSGQERLRIECSYLEEEYLAAQKLFRQEVIPEREYEKARTAYFASLAEGEAFRESYLDRLEEELEQILLDMARYRGEIAAIEASLPDYCILAPAGGTLHRCPGISRGSVLQPGSPLGCIVPEGSVVAECYVESRVRTDIRPGSAVSVRIDRLSRHPERILETRVSQIDPQAVVVNGTSCYRIRCDLDETERLSGPGDPGRVLPGMGFTASVFLGRTRLSSLLLEKLNRWGNPLHPVRPDIHPQKNGS
jgi:multidrug resistance efflux pump